jgi:hypothetical protein
VDSNGAYVQAGDYFLLQGTNFGATMTNIVVTLDTITITSSCTLTIAHVLITCITPSRTDIAAVLQLYVTVGGQPSTNMYLY